MSTTSTPCPTFTKSRTCRLLQHAAAAHDCARQRYQEAALRCEEDDLHVAAHAFRFTAAQEKQHHAVLTGLLQSHGGTAPDAACPVDDLCRTPQELLRQAAEAETESSDMHLPQIAEAAEMEGYPRIAAAARRIAENEHLHALRFAAYADALEDGSLFHAGERTGWLCLQCSEIRYGLDAPERCASCGSPRGSFIRSDFTPFCVRV